jgi:DNA replication protein DnaC
VREVDLVEGLKASYDDGAPEREETILARLSAVQLLVLDDLGASYVPRGSGDAGEASTWYSERLYQIIDRRTAAQRPLIVTSNLSKARLRERLGPATVSRLEGLQWIWFGGRDRR